MAHAVLVASIDLQQYCATDASCASDRLSMLQTATVVEATLDSENAYSSSKLSVDLDGGRSKKKVVSILTRMMTSNIKAKEEKKLKNMDGWEKLFKVDSESHQTAQAITGDGCDLCAAVPGLTVQEHHKVYFPDGALYPCSMAVDHVSAWPEDCSAAKAVLGLQCCIPAKPAKETWQCDYCLNGDFHDGVYITDENGETTEFTCGQMRKLFDQLKELPLVEVQEKAKEMGADDADHLCAMWQEASKTECCK